MNRASHYLLLPLVFKNKHHYVQSNYKFNLMKSIVKTLWVTFLFLFALPHLYAAPTATDQEIQIKGKVIDALNEGMPGVNVLIKGTSRGTITDVNGNYTIAVANKNAILIFSFIGYTDQEMVVGKQTVIHVQLKEDFQNLEEVVVVAYGTQTKATITGALSTMGTEELTKIPVASLTNVLAGALPGVSTVQSSGQPGRDAAAIYVRGCGSLSNAAAKPLILVDGVEREFSQIDPNEIETVSVLKDASSTAVFGVRGANGVVLVTTRRGISGKPVISVSTSLGLQEPISLVSQTDSYGFASFWNIKKRADNIVDPKLYFTPEQIEAYRTGSDPIMYPNINWKEYMYSKLFLQSKNNINISGGNDRVKYFISLGYLYQNGILKQFDALSYDNNYRYDRYNYRANLDVKLTGTTTMKLNIGGNVGKTKEPKSVEDIDNTWIYAQIWALPIAGAGIINGKRTLVPGDMIPLEGEVVRDGLGTFWGYGYNQYYDTTLNLDMEITQNLDMLTPGLSVAVKGAYDNKFNLNKYRTGYGAEYQRANYKSFLEDNSKPQTDPYYDKTVVFTPIGEDYPLYYSEDYGRDRNWYMEVRMNYDRTFGDHKVSGLVLYNQSRDYYPLNANGWAASYQYLPRGYVGLVGRVTYSYQTKYLLDANVGYNGSENFAPGKTRYGLFPSVSAGWVVSAEKFMERQKVIEYLKLRASWGRVGSDVGNSTRFMYMPGVWTGNGEYSFGVNNPVSSPAYGLGTPGNNLVSWETAEKQNYGIDLKLLQGRLSLNADYFIEHRKDILIAPQSVPGIIATGLPNLNLGIVDNKGYEIMLGWNDRAGDVNYSVSGNVSYARNKIIFKDEVPNTYSYLDETGGSTGRSKGIYQYERLYQYSDFSKDASGNLILNPELPQPYVKVSPGDAMYADLNSDNIVDGEDKMTFGYSNRPEYVFGLNTSIDYKGFNFSTQWTGATHVNKMMEVEFRIPFTNAGTRGLLDYFVGKCWTPENQWGATMPRASEQSETWNSEMSTLWLRDASYVRLKSLSLSYTWKNKPALSKLGMKSVALSFSGFNLLTFSPLDIIDPEGLTTNTGGYPLTKLYNFGLTINF